jgi:hypothetical protein
MTPRFPCGAWDAKGCSERRARCGQLLGYAAHRPLVLLLLLHSPSNSCDITLSPWCSSRVISALTRKALVGDCQSDHEKKVEAREAVKMDIDGG